MGGRWLSPVGSTMTRPGVSSQFVMSWCTSSKKGAHLETEIRRKQTSLVASYLWPEQYHECMGSNQCCRPIIQMGQCNEFHSAQSRFYFCWTISEWLTCKQQVSPKGNLPLTYHFQPVKDRDNVLSSVAASSWNWGVGCQDPGGLKGSQWLGNRTFIRSIWLAVPGEGTGNNHIS